MTTNKDLVRRFVDDLFSQGDFSCCAQIAAPTYLEHAVAPFGNEAPGLVPGPTHLEEAARWLRDQFPTSR